MLKLYDYFRSSASYRVRIALNLKGLEYQCIPVHLVNNGGEQHTAEYQKLNPQALVPTLITTENQPITQSLSIIEYLNDTHPTPDLLPPSQYDRALVRAFALSIAADIHPLNNLRVLNYLTAECNIDDATKNTWYRHWVELGFEALEKQLQHHTLKGDFCFGQQPTLADICLIPQMYNARRFNCDLTPFPRLCEIDATCQQIEAFALAAPKEPVM